ncbi:fibrinogen alpha chain-like [Gigantopelta aegis]|uniref:fibrinogen alpha chain-like n=1 Tax=Gigantopelta aegis TaxID=1735272 RepID=UPI001B88D2B8|nr:fibrinogen alpha chain-like [Gigantopelta aegis]
MAESHAAVSMYAIFSTMRNATKALYQEHVHDHLDVVLADDINVTSARECSVFCLNVHCDVFAFCPTTPIPRASANTNCFLFTYSDGVASANLSEYSACSFYVSKAKQTVLSTEITTDMSTTTSPSTTITTASSAATTPIDTTTAASTTATTHSASTIPSDTTTTSSTTTNTTCVNLDGGGCTCPSGATDVGCTQYLSDCVDYKNTHGILDGVVYIKPLTSSLNAFPVRCYKGYTMIQMRDNVPSCHSFSFNRSWSEYRDGFGDLQNGCFWLGNDKITTLTLGRAYALMFETLVNSQTTELVITYNAFQMASPANGYRLSYGWIAESSAVPNSNGLVGPTANRVVKDQPFYTYDHDINGCAAASGGGWWYNTGCSYGNLNGVDAKWPLSGTVTKLDISLLYLQRP